MQSADEFVLERAGPSPLGGVRLELAGRIGSEEDDDYLFSIVRGLGVDNDDNVVVFDGIMRNIRVFDPEGQILQTYWLQDGVGPGEFQRASTFSLSHDKEKIYLYDMVNRRITILDYPSFDFIDLISIPEIAHAVVAGAPDRAIIALYDQLSLGDQPLIHVFSETGAKLAEFEQRHPDFRANLRKDLQAFHAVFMSQSDSLIFVSFALPYDIRVYNRRYELLRRFHLTPDFFGSTVRDGEWLYPSGYCLNLVVAGDNLLLQFVRNRKDDEIWMHAFDFEGRSRGVQRMVNNEWGDRFGVFKGTMDSSGHLYGVTSDPFPQVIKLKVVPDGT